MSFPPPVRILRTAALVTVVLLVPLVAAALIGGGDALSPAVMGLMSAAVIPFCTRRQALGFTVGLVVTGTLATAAAGSTAAVVALVVVASLAAGLASRVSAGVYGVAPIVAAVLGMGPSGVSPLRAGVVMAGVCAYVTLVMVLAKVHVAPTPVPWEVAVRHALVMAAACGTATAIGLHYAWPRASWLVMTLAIVLRPYAGESLRRNVQRVTGTVAGAAIAVLLSPLPRPWQVVFAAVCMTLMLAYLMLKNYTLQVTFMTPMVVFLISSGAVEDTLNTDGLRVLYTVAACAVGGALALLLARQEQT